ncbi:UDP-glucose 4-epimerase GalE [Geothermobacter hydrogeniphilus]|uniref:UDP-glucose 4-epimerase n=1 Tax=Geothermobacter hydrogeniphilus TaxID=1969733 RepID=A0A2K2H9V1_9BACT|nr:UDP-glucose 4-epimerase GalE [Geothermobacter hydrogeniphilus]PNU20095.1 UDP-glucose 4-epimerase GalE [Geothermobacter hydrogeniphilus]
MSILVTGGAGYIGSHTVLELLQAGQEVVVVDNLSNASPVSLERVAELTGRQARLEVADIRDRSALRRIFDDCCPTAVVHFAGLKAVGESCEMPLAYYQNNVAGTATLCEVMAEAGCKRLVFSSSATVYGDPASLPIREDFPTGATNPYGRTKLFIEEMLRDLHTSDSEWRIALLRYFNPIGAHESGCIGENPNGIPNNLFPFITQVAVGKRERLSIFGDDYPTVDGTGVRDYIHVVDLALGHLRALERLEREPGLVCVNLGTGQGYSVLQMVEAFQRINNIAVPYRIVARRPGDIAACYADPSLAVKELGWTAERGLEEMCRDGWRWQRQNPNGYAGE